MGRMVPRATSIRRPRNLQALGTGASPSCPHSLSRRASERGALLQRLAADDNTDCEAFRKVVKGPLFFEQEPKFLRDFVDDITPAMTPLENAHFQVPRRISAPLNLSPIGGRVQRADKRMVPMLITT